MADNEIGLRVNGTEYRGWKSARVIRSIEAIAPSFELSVSERWQADLAPWPIHEEDECVVVIGTDKVCTGIVDVRRPAFTKDGHSLTIGGRDALGVLVDCSVRLSTWEFKNLTVPGMVKKVCAPFGINVSTQTGLVFPAPPAKFSVDPGDTAFNVIEQACRLAGVIAISDGNGGLLLTRTGTDRADTALVEGDNILAASATFDCSGRFRHYRALGQHRGSDEVAGESASKVVGTAEDKNVRRTARTLVIRPEGNVTAALAKKRAEWEAKTRAARGDTVTVTVQGWRQASGALWPVNKLVPVKIPHCGVDGDMMITQTAFDVNDDTGTTTEISLARPDALTPEPTISTASTGLWKEISNGV